MSHFAQIDDNNRVIQVLVVEQDQIDTGLLGDPSRWIQTSYNTQGGVHLAGGTPLRKNFAGVGMYYDPDRDAFIAEKPYPSWILDEESCLWQAPVPQPARPDKWSAYIWDEEQVNWVLIDMVTGLPKSDQ